MTTRQFGDRVKHDTNLNTVLLGIVVALGAWNLKETVALKEELASTRPVVAETFRRMNLLESRVESLSDRIVGARR